MKNINKNYSDVYMFMLHAYADYYEIDPKEVQIILGFRPPGTPMFNWMSSIDTSQAKHLHKMAIEAMDEHENLKN
jgi:hypothetical protein